MRLDKYQNTRISLIDPNLLTDQIYYKDCYVLTMSFNPYQVISNFYLQQTLTMQDVISR